ncbi:MAG: 2-phosphosulfolactate phosphatase [Lachnospiraceae bacterium]|nr:2-phosphosulfolactate phosphatase [Lachnospiraceae bacterium]
MRRRIGQKEKTGRILIGERGGRICEGFECGGSPFTGKDADCAGRTIVHTTSAGTRGLS